MDVILGLVTTGVKKLVELIPLWIGASQEQKIEIEAKAKSLVGGLDSLFATADAKDDANTRKARDAIGNTKPE